MYVVVVLKSSLVLKAVPIKFIKEFNPIGMANDAIDQSETHLVFFSKNFDESPNFDADLKTDFDEEQPGCYEARFLKFFGKNRNFPTILSALLFI